MRGTPEPSPPGTLRVPLPRTVEGCLGHRQYRAHGERKQTRWQAPLYRGGRGAGGEGSQGEGR
jgi:hypothetical protein